MCVSVRWPGWYAGRAQHPRPECNSSKTPAVLCAVHIGEVASEIDHVDEAWQKHCFVQVARVVRLESAASRASGLGTLVWGKDSSGAWWPGEALDPARLPPGRALPPASLAGMQSACALNA